MEAYSKPKRENWIGRESDQNLYVHQKVQFLDLESIAQEQVKKSDIVFLGYACDEGVKRNQGRIGAQMGPDAIRKQLGKQPEHLSESLSVFDAGNIECLDGDMQSSQNELAQIVKKLLSKNFFPILLGEAMTLHMPITMGSRNI